MVGEKQLSHLHYIFNFSSQYPPAIKLLQRAKRIKDESLPLEKKILKFFNHRQLRAGPLSPQALIRAERILKKIVKTQEPIQIVYFIGGYKHYLSFSFPFPNAAELFFLYFWQIINLAIKIIYPPGIRLHLIFDIPKFIAKVTFLPQAFVELYQREFQKLISLLELSFIKIEEAKVYQERIKLSSQVKKSFAVNFNYLKKIFWPAKLSSQTNAAELENWLRKSIFWHDEYVTIIDRIFLQKYPLALFFVPKKTKLEYLLGLQSFFGTLVQCWVGTGAIVDEQITIIGPWQQKESFLFHHFVKIETAKLKNLPLNYLPVFIRWKKK